MLRTGVYTNRRTLKKWSPETTDKRGGIEKPNE